MSDSMRKIVRRCFPNAIRVIDRSCSKTSLRCSARDAGAHRWDAINEGQMP